MGVLKRVFGREIKINDELFNQANYHWQTRQRALINYDHVKAQSELLKVIQLCQKAISLEPQKQANAYILLTNALLVAKQSYDNADNDLLLKYAAACIGTWWILPYKDWPSSSDNYKMGLHLRQTVSQLLAEVSSPNEEHSIDGCVLAFGELITSPIGLNRITDALSSNNRIKFPANGTRSQDTEIIILENMCQLPEMINKIIQAGSSNYLTEAEISLLTKKYLGGKTVFPIEPTASVENAERWLNDPSFRVMVTSVAMNYSTMESLLRRVLKNEYTIYYEMAKQRLATRK